MVIDKSPYIGLFILNLAIIICFLHLLLSFSGMDVMFTKHLFLSHK
jgi:hypothetical protein